MLLSTITPSAVSMTLMITSLGFLCYSILRSQFPGKGLQVIQNIFKETTSFEEAIKALKEGKRIRRKTERKGFTRIVITEGKNQTEKYGTYWVGDKNISDYCSFSLDDVLATDWIVDE